MDEIYEFVTLGSYTIKFIAPDKGRRSNIVTAADDAKQDVAKIAVVSNVRSGSF
jgi:hypothetical protein